MTFVLALDGNIHSELAAALGRIDAGRISITCALPECSQAGSGDFAIYVAKLGTNVRFCSPEHVRVAITRWGLQVCSSTDVVSVLG